jgi:hypothetical protein
MPNHGGQAVEEVAQLADGFAIGGSGLGTLAGGAKAALERLGDGVAVGR